ncbi:hypothetical protein FS842_010845 [Serendipita sp. 407]|nr:hypothetical protein FS842_010845 [Serendipita sp. 407]
MFQTQEKLTKGTQEIHEAHSCASGSQTTARWSWSTTLGELERVQAGSASTGDEACCLGYDMLRSEAVDTIRGFNDSSTARNPNVSGHHRRRASSKSSKMTYEVKDIKEKSLVVE